MIADKKIETLDHSAARLTVTIDKDAAKKEYDSLLQKYSKTAHIKGFRKGKVPANILEQKYGESIRSEAGLQLIESSLEEVFKEIDRKPLQFEPPELQDEVDMKIGEDFTFTVTYDTFPDIELGSYTGIEVEQDSVTVGTEEVNAELERIQDQNAIVVDKDDAGAVEASDIVTVNYVELGEGDAPVEGTERQDFTFTVGTGYNRFKIDDDIIGMKKNDEKIIEKSFEEDFEDEELKGKTFRLKVTVTQIKRKDLPALDDELAQDVSEEYKTLEDLKKDIKKQLKEAADNRIRQKTVQAIIDKIVENSKIDLPESMIRAELEGSWRNFLNRSRIDEKRMLSYLEAQNQTKEDMLSEWRKDAEQSIKARLVLNEIAEKEKIEATDEDLDEAIKEQAERSNTDVETTREQLANARMMDYLKSQIADRKLYDYLVEKAELKKGKKVKLLDLLQDNQ